MYGGYIQDYHNLSQHGDCAVLDNAMVFESATVSDNAIVMDCALVFEYAEIYGDASVLDEAVIFGNASIGDDSIVRHNSVLCGDVTMCGDAEISVDSQTSYELAAGEDQPEELSDTIAIMGYNNTFTIHKKGVSIDGNFYQIDIWEEDAENILLNFGYSHQVASQIKFATLALSN
jgi:hypothetical protein